jgi:proteasome-associated ATPase
MATKDELEVALKDARTVIRDLEAYIEKATRPPLLFGTIAIIDGSTITVSVQGNFMEMPCPQHCVPELGYLVAISAESKVPVSIRPPSLPGPIMPVKRRISPTLVELSQGPAGIAGSSKSVLFSGPVDPGDLLQLDMGQNVGTLNLGPDPLTASANVVDEFQPVSWDDIGGLEDVKRFFFEVLEQPLLNPAIYRKYGIPAPKGCLMSGPPGCGKTLIARAVMTDLLRRHGHSGNGAFLSVKGPEILSPWVGMTEQNIRQLFDKARKFKQLNGFPAIIFIDEAEAIMNVRGSGRSSDVDRTIVPAFLAEMDGVEDSGALVLLATNRPEMLDPAIVREGRIDKKIRIPRPNATACAKILEINLKRYPLDSPTSLSRIVEDLTSFIFSGNHDLYHAHMDDDSIIPFGIRHVLSGAFLAASVQQAASIALTRDLAANCVQGIRYEDLCDSINNLVTQHRHLEYRADADIHFSSHKDSILKLEKVPA